MGRGSGETEKREETQPRTDADEYRWAGLPLPLGERIEARGKMAETVATTPLGSILV
jgi:hypothetical protein